MTVRDLPSVVTLLAASDVALGAGLATAPQRRLSGPGISTALRIMPATWLGLTIAALGVLILLTFASIHEGALWLAAAWYGFFATTLVYSFFTIRTTGVLGVTWCLTLFTMHVLAAIRWVR